MLDRNVTTQSVDREVRVRQASLDGPTCASAPVVLSPYPSGNLGYLGIALDLKIARRLQLMSGIELVGGLTA